ncbi:MAG: DUF2628 domain-containing protein [Actinomycetia bacterium]|nr:DUF2628 domain-containing protein [Actinomycetes bacterium]
MSDFENADGVVDEGFGEFVEVDAAEPEVVDAEVVDEVVVEPEVVDAEVVSETIPEASVADKATSFVDSAVSTVGASVKNLTTESSISSFNEAATFIGPNADYYIPRFQQMEASGSPMSWNWSAFFFGLFWMLYRKMWLYALIAWAVLFVLELVPVIGQIVPFVAWIGLGLFGNFIYKKFVEEELAKAAPLAPAERKAQLAARGGISWIPAIIAGVLIALLVAGAVCSVLGLASLGSLSDAL